MRARSLAASLIAATALAVTPAIPAGATPGHDGQHVGTTEADTIHCFTIQAPGWLPPAVYNEHWRSEWVRQRADGRWEVAVGTDIGSEPACVEAIPGSGIWVNPTDLADVTAYLKAKDLAARGVVEIAGEEVPAALDLYDWQRLADCESGGQWATVDRGRRFFGGLQLTIPGADRLSVADQIDLARGKLDREGPGAWPGCSKRIGWS